MKNNQIEKYCPVCGDLIVGRADKVFCSDHCRNYYNNKANSDSNNLMRNINNALRRNRRILEELYEEKLLESSKDNLTIKGFNFNYYTHTDKIDNGNECYFCYDIGYQTIDQNQVLLIRKFEHKR